MATCRGLRRGTGLALLCVLLAPGSSCGNGDGDPTRELCELVGVEQGQDVGRQGATVGEMLTSDDDAAVLGAMVVAVISSTREGDFDDLGPYEVGMQAVVRRGQARLDELGGEPAAEVADPTAAERRSARTADAAIAGGSCDA